MVAGDAPSEAANSITVMREPFIAMWFEAASVTWRWRGFMAIRAF
jgi:hypothetical protein